MYEGEPTTTAAQSRLSRRVLSRRTVLGGIGVTIVASATVPLGAVSARGASAATARDAHVVSGLEIAVDPAVIGRGMPLVGYNTGHFLPGGNASAWLEYSRVNAVRFFAALTEWTPDSAFDPGAGIATVADFDARKDELRANPEANRFLRWDVLNDIFENHVYASTNYYRLNYQLSELKRLGITPIIEAAELAWNRPWSGLWLQWQKHYAFAYHLARHFDVERFNFVNEPDHPSAAGDIVNQQVYIRGLQVMSDAVRCAITDVNAKYAKQLRAMVHAPVVTHISSSVGNDHMDPDPDSDARDDQYGWGQIAMMNLRTNYRGETVDYDIFNVFDTHKYNVTAGTYATEIAMARQRMAQYSPTSVALPLVYSEFNRRNTGAFETSGDDLNTPVLYVDLANIWSTALAGQVEGMIAFKFQNTMRSNGIPYGTGFYYVDNTGVCDIHGVTKAGEVNRLFAKGFAGPKPLLQVSAGAGRSISVSHDPAARRHYLWLPQQSGGSSGPVTLDLTRLPVSAVGTQVIVEEVSPAHSADIVSVTTLPRSKRVTLDQPADSVWLVTIADDGQDAPRAIEAYADARVPQDGSGPDAQLDLAVSRSVTGANEVSYLAFDLGPGKALGARRAHLELHGVSVDGAPLTFTVYVLTDTAWAGQNLDWATAPFLDVATLHPTDVGGVVFPAGQLTATGSPGTMRLDVTDALSHAVDETVGFLLVREARNDRDTADDGRRAQLASRQAAQPQVRPRLLIWT